MSPNFKRKGHHPATTVGVKKLVIALSCGIKISAVHCLVLSQSTRVADGQNYDSKGRASIAASHSKNGCDSATLEWEQQQNESVLPTAAVHNPTAGVHNLFHR